MKFLLLFVSSCFLIGFVQSQTECNLEAYRAYLKDWNKEEESDLIKFNQKKEQYCLKLKEVETWNSQSNKSYTLGINQFSDLLDEEIRQRVNTQFLEVSEIPIGQAKQRNQGFLTLGAGTGVPNWKASNKVSSIKYQKQCGSCWAFTTAGLYESYMMVKGKKEYDLSEEFILECTDVLVDTKGSTSDCRGGILDYSLKLAKQQGIPEEITYPYTSGDYGTKAGFTPTNGICTATVDFIKYDSMTGVKNETTLTRYENQTNEQIKTLLEDSPVAAAIYADPGFMSYTSGIYSGCPDSATSISKLNHAVIIVGMDQNQNYIIKNSWGTGWGESGFITVSATQDCGITRWIYQYTWGSQIMTSLFFVLLSILVVMF